MIDRPTITTVTERRQVAQTKEFPADLAPYIDWEKINEIRTQLGSDLHVTSHKDGRITVVFSWSYTEEEFKNETNILHAVANAIMRRYDTTGIDVDYPGFISIPEKIVNDDVDASDNVWAVGESDDGAWTGNLMTPDGQVVPNMAFAVLPKSQSPDDIADAVYGHGIGDCYVGGGCSDPECPSKRYDREEVKAH